MLEALKIDRISYSSYRVLRTYTYFALLLQHENLNPNPTPTSGPYTFAD